MNLIEDIWRLLIEEDEGDLPRLDKNIFCRYPAQPLGSVRRAMIAKQKPIVSRDEQRRRKWQPVPVQTIEPRRKIKNHQTVVPVEKKRGACPMTVNAVPTRQLRRGYQASEDSTRSQKGFSSPHLLYLPLGMRHGGPSLWKRDRKVMKKSRNRVKTWEGRPIGEKTVWKRMDIMQVPLAEEAYIGSQSNGQRRAWSRPRQRAVREYVREVWREITDCV